MVDDPPRDFLEDDSGLSIRVLRFAADLFCYNAGRSLLKHCQDLGRVSRCVASLLPDARGRIQ